MILFVGAGPGAPDLITLRGLKAVQEADLIVYAGSLVNPEILKQAKSDCDIRDSAKMALDEIVNVMADGVEAGKKVVRLHTGDPSVYGAIAEQMAELDKKGITYQVVPGVSSVFASAAALNAELTMPGISQTVILTRRAGRTPVPEGQSIPELAAHQATMCLFLSVSEIESLVEELISGGYPAETPVGVVYRATWEDQKIVRGELANIAEKIADNKISRQAMIIVGAALGKDGEYSKLYDENFAHGYREAAKQ